METEKSIKLSQSKTPRRNYQLSNSILSSNVNLINTGIVNRIEREFVGI
ncbi:unnamed protein product [Prunus brigantina]